MKTSTITEIEPKGTFTNKHGTFYAFEVTLENGDSGRINKKSQDALSNGQALTYVLEDKTWPDGKPYTKIKEMQDKPFGANGRGSNASFSASYMKDIVAAKVAALGRQGKPIPPANDLASMTIEGAEIIYAWLESKN